MDIYLVNLVHLIILLRFILKDAFLRPFSTFFYVIFLGFSFPLLIFQREIDRETERQRDTETQRHRDRETERQRDRETERHRDRETERHRDTETER